MINPSYVISSAAHRGPSVPIVQPFTYRPSVGQRLPLCLPADTVATLAPQAQKFIGAMIAPIQSVVVNQEENVYPLADARFSLLAMPPDDYYAKQGEDPIHVPDRGFLKANPEYRSYTQLLVLILLGDAFIPDAMGKPQVFGINLKGLATNWVNGQHYQFGNTIAAHNAVIAQHYGLSGWVAHCMATQIEVAGAQAASNANGQMSIRTYYEIKKGAQPLPEPLQQKANQIAADPSFQRFAADPFRVAGESPEAKLLAAFAQFIKSVK